MKYIVFLLAIFLFSCTTTSTVTFPDGKVIKLSARADEMVTITRDNTTYIFDRRGKPTLFESIITMMFMDTKLKNEVKEE